MSKKTPKEAKVKVEAKSTEVEKYILRLFVTGILPNSVRAIVNSKAICEEYLKDRYELEIIDIYQQPSLAVTEEIIAIPVLIKKFPLPEGRVIGDLSDVEKVLKGLHII
ncbi:circadian clock KaiB family protein [Flavobacterium sp. LS2P90]|uniref:Circadian clock KaiB family protein n=1 Tax=Flavobacterium xylosi TaxID=3230415 RepID=A0ABW6HXV1_9FLAO